MNDSELGRTLAAAAFSRIRADILGSRLLPGTRLRFEPLKKAYGVGLSPLREALSRLVVSGPVVGAVYSPIHSSFHDESYWSGLQLG